MTPAVTAVVPARDEVDTIASTVRSLLEQDYDGRLSVVVVDDGSVDGTAEAARAAASPEEKVRLRVVAGTPLPVGWTGKMWAVAQGIEAAGAPRYIWLTDADVRHAPDTLRRLVAKAEARELGLVSLMVLLRCRSVAEKLLIPAFVYFFQKLYPFAWVNDPERPLAAAAGGCMLVRRRTLEASGGIAMIKDRVIDDCALAALIKPLRPIWLGLTGQSVSLRAYDGIGPIWRMVVRTAYVQLRHNPALLSGTVAGMILLYVVPPLAVVLGVVSANDAWVVFGASAWGAMAWSFLPMLDLYGRSALWAPTLPVAGLLYALMTLDSARRHYAGVGGAWKGRTYDAPGQQG